MKLSQIFKRPTPKQFVFISFAYALVAPLLGSILGSPLLAGMSLFIFLLFAMVCFLYLRPSLPEGSMNLASGMIWVFLSVMFFLESAQLFTKIETDESQLQQVSGPMPADKSKLSEQNRALKIGETYLHCDLVDADYCKAMFEGHRYTGKTVTAYYQPTFLAGNLTYEIEVDGIKVYRYEQQRSAFQALQTEKRKQWAWAILLYALPSFWFIVQNRRIIKSIPKVSDSEFKQLRLNPENNIDSGATFVIYIYGTFAILFMVGAAILLVVQKLIWATICLAGVGFGAYLIYRIMRETYPEL